MAEKIKIFELDIDIDAAIASTSELKKESEFLKKQLDALKRSGDTSSETYVRLESAYKGVRKESNSAQQQIAKMISLQGKEIKTVEQARNALSVVGKEWAKQADLYGANSKEADKLAKKKLELSNRLKELEGNTGDTSRSVGGYTEAILAAQNQNTLFAKAQRNINEILKVGKPVFAALKLEIASVGKNYKILTASTQGYTKAQKAAAISTFLMNTALKAFKIALVATGIGAILVLVGSLIAYLTKTQKGVDFVSKALAGLGAFFDVIIDRLSQLGGALLKFISGDFVGAFNDVKEAASGLGDEIAREVRLAYELEAALQKLRDTEIGLITTQAARKKQIAELRLLAKDEATSLQERAKLLQQAGDIEKKILDDELTLAREKARISQQQLDLGESTAEQIRENAELQANVINLETESLQRRKSIEAERQGLLKRAASEQAAAAKATSARAKKEIDDAIKESKVKLQIFIEENKGKAKALEDSLIDAERIRDEKLKINEEELEAGNKTQTEAELERLKIKNEFLEKQKELTIAFAEEELAIIRSSHQKRIEENQLLTDELVAQEIARLEAIAEAEREYQLKRFQEGEISERQYNDNIRAINEENRAAKAEQEEELKQQKAEAAAIDLDNQRILDQERLTYDLELQRQYLEQEKQAELDKAEKTGADKSKIEAKYAAIDREISAKTNDAKLSLAADAFNGLATILGKYSDAGKAAAIAETTITTFQSAVNSYNSLSGIPIVGPVLGGIAAAAAVASGLAQVQKIRNTKKPDVPKAEKGALFEIGGQRHSNGGTLFTGEDGTSFEAEKGELIGVMNRRAAKMFMGFNNQFTGSSTSKPNYFADGGFVSRSFTTNSTANSSQSGNVLDIDLLASKIADANRQLPAPITDVRDIINGVGSFNNVVDGANI
ncbi:coiled-coil domain-containing protein [Aquimarina intermedia]|uniref:Uncharacterized protein n=1 Tax=Aquimarina intermedia TaxID=350814 RepID=A0A5S5BWY8_9FLAO|nr:hypothetical protein [Aquimarina intermedia]TYP71489.1 hypothetical protein BD809_10971 [Aquimarina intermedia]